MADEDATAPDQLGGPVPALPRKLAEPTPVVLVGTALWLVGTVFFGVLGWFENGIGVEFWTCASGVVLGIIGFGVFRWQRSASRRGSRGAWRGLSGLDE